MDSKRWQIRPLTLALLIILFFVADRAMVVGSLLPDFCVEDERWIQEGAVRMVQDLTLDPGTHKYPGLMFTLTAASYATAFVAANLTALLHFESGESFRFYLAHYNFDLTSTIVTGRLMVIGLGAIALLLFYRLFRRETDDATALVSIMLLFTTPAFLFSTSLLKNDVLVMIGVLLTVSASLRILERGDPRSYLLAGAALGFCLAAKYHAPALLPILVAHRLRHRDAPWWKVFGKTEWAWGLAAAAAAFMVLSPYTWLDLPGAIQQGGVELAIQNDFDPLLRRSPGLWRQAPVLFIFSSVLPLALGIPLYLLSLAGLVRKLRLDSPRRLVLWSYPAGLLVYMTGLSQLGVPHLFLPAVPFLALAAAMIISPLLEGTRLRRAAAVAIIGLISAYNLVLFHGFQRTEEFVLIKGAREMERTHQPGERDLALVPYFPNPGRNWRTLFAPQFLLSRELLATYNPDRILVHHAFYNAYLDNQELLDAPILAEMITTYLLLRKGDLGYQEQAKWTEGEGLGITIMAGPYQAIWPDLTGMTSSLYVRKEPYGDLPP